MILVQAHAHCVPHLLFKTNQKPPNVHMNNELHTCFRIVNQYGMNAQQFTDIKFENEQDFEFSLDFDVSHRARKCECVYCT